MSDDPGMMSGAYFVGKRALLEWANEFLGTEIKKVEEFSTGWAHCQLVDSLFPGEVNLSKYVTTTSNQILPLSPLTRSPIRVTYMTKSNRR